MTPHDADLAQAAFAGFTNAETMRSLLALPIRALWDDAHRIVECEVAHAWRKTYGRAASWHKSHLRVCYRLHLARGEAGGAFSAWVHGTVRLGSDRAGSHASPTAAVTLGMATLRLHRFPDDPGLPQLAHVVDPAAARARLGQFVGVDLQGDATVTVLCHRPGERSAVRVTAGEASAFAKTYRGDAGGRVHRHLCHLFAAGRRGERRFAVAEPLGHDAGTGTVWQRWIDGGTVAKAVDAPDFAARVGQCARALAGLHAAALEDLAPRDRAQLLYETRKRAVKLGLAHPAAAEALERVMNRLLRALDTLPVTAGTVIHGDVHLEQFLLQDDDVAMADVDEIALGDAEQDVAALMLDLRLRAAAAGTAAPWPDIAASAYASCAASPIVHELFVWHLTRHCIDKAYRLHWRNAPGLEPVVTALLGWAEASARELTGAPS